MAKQLGQDGEPIIPADEVVGAIVDTLPEAKANIAAEHAKARLAERLSALQGARRNHVGGALRDPRCKRLNADGTPAETDGYEQSARKWEDEGEVEGNDTY